MNQVVLDTSIVIKWFRKEIDEPHAEKAKAILDDYFSGETNIIVPELLFYEFGNAMKFKQTIPEKVRKGYLEDLFSMGFDIVPLDMELACLSFELSMKFDLTFYDACFVALSQQLDCDFITADEKLYEAVKELLMVHLLSKL